jgi:hypothetical protein
VRHDHPPAVPTGPADTTHPRRALARLALSSAYREAADFAAGGVPTVSDEYGDPWDYIDHAARLLTIAQDVLARTVIYARERGGTWSTIAEALDTTPEQAQERYTGTLDRWDNALDQPWERSGRFLASRMPDGTTDPDQTAADLDQWCLRHLEDNHGSRHNARHDGIEDCMVSANLPKHSPVTELTSLTRTAAYLARRGAEATDAERDAYQQRKARVLATLRAAEEMIP